MIRTRCSCGASLDVDHGSQDDNTSDAHLRAGREREDIARFTRAHRDCRKAYTTELDAIADDLQAIGTDLAAVRADREKVIAELEVLSAKHQALRDAIARVISSPNHSTWPADTRVLLLHVGADITADLLDAVGDAVRGHVPAGLWDMTVARSGHYIHIQRLRDAIEEVS